MRLAGKVAVVTGGGSGIGRATAQRFAEEGAKVAVVDLNLEAAQETVRLIQQKNGNGQAIAVQADVSRSSEVENYVNATVNAFDRIDVFHNNAGIGTKWTSVVEHTEEMFDRVMAVNVRGMWLGLKYIIPVMRRNGGGSIIITSSGVGVTGSAGWAAYSASKHAVIGLMRTAALEEAENNIRLNAICPGTVETPAMQGALGESGKATYLNYIPMRRIGKPEEIANFVLFLASDESSYCTGGVYLIDGGKSAGTVNK
jgi:NAD(P)-dependent dehydrogenase (short-subunit alcohol dehydrogenase family)